MKVMCFAMREGIVDQRSDVCGDAETNVNERRTTTAVPPTPVVLLCPLLHKEPTCLCASPLPITQQSFRLFFSLSHSAFASHCLFEPRDSYTLIQTQIFVYNHIYLPRCTRVCMCVDVFNIAYYVSLVHIPYVKCQSKRIRRRAHKYVYTQYWVWQPWQTIISVHRNTL